MPFINQETLQILITLASQAVTDNQSKYLRQEDRLRQLLDRNGRCLAEVERARKALCEAMDAGKRAALRLEE